MDTSEERKARAREAIVSELVVQQGWSEEYAIGFVAKRVRVQTLWKSDDVLLETEHGSRGVQTAEGLKHFAKVLQLEHPSAPLGASPSRATEGDADAAQHHDVAVDATRQRVRSAF